MIGSHGTAGGEKPEEIGRRAWGLRGWEQRELPSTGIPVSHLLYIRGTDLLYIFHCRVVYIYMCVCNASVRFKTTALYRTPRSVTRNVCWFAGCKSPLAVFFPL